MAFRGTVVHALYRRACCRSGLPGGPLRCSDECWDLVQHARGSWPAGHMGLQQGSNSCHLRRLGHDHSYDTVEDRHDRFQVGATGGDRHNDVAAAPGDAPSRSVAAELPRHGAIRRPAVKKREADAPPGHVAHVRVLRDEGEHRAAWCNAGLLPAFEGTVSAQQFRRLAAQNGVAQYGAKAASQARALAAGMKAPSMFGATLDARLGLGDSDRGREDGQRGVLAVGGGGEHSGGGGGGGGARVAANDHHDVLVVGGGGGGADPDPGDAPGDSDQSKSESQLGDLAPFGHGWADERGCPDNLLPWLHPPMLARVGELWSPRQRSHPRFEMPLAPLGGYVGARPRASHRLRKCKSVTFCCARGCPLELRAPELLGKAGWEGEVTGPHSAARQRCSVAMRRSRTASERASAHQAQREEWSADARRVNEERDLRPSGASTGASQPLAALNFGLLLESDAEVESLLELGPLLDTSDLELQGEAVGGAWGNLRNVRDQAKRARSQASKKRKQNEEKTCHVAGNFGGAVAAARRHLRSTSLGPLAMRQSQELFSGDGELGGAPAVSAPGTSALHGGPLARQPLLRRPQTSGATVKLPEAAARLPGALQDVMPTAAVEFKGAQGEPAESRVGDAAGNDGGVPPDARERASQASARALASCSASCDIDAMMEIERRLSNDQGAHQQIGPSDNASPVRGTRQASGRGGDNLGRRLSKDVWGDLTRAGGRFLGSGNSGAFSMAARHMEMFCDETAQARGAAGRHMVEHHAPEERAKFLGIPDIWRKANGMVDHKAQTAASKFQVSDAEVDQIREVELPASRGKTTSGVAGDPDAILHGGLLRAGAGAPRQDSAEPSPTAEATFYTPGTQAVLRILLAFAWCYLHRLKLPHSSGWSLVYAAVVTAFCYGLYKVTKYHLPMEALHIEVLLPAFVVGCMIDTPCARHELQLQRQATMSRLETKRQKSALSDKMRLAGICASENNVNAAVPQRIAAGVELPQRIVSGGSRLSRHGVDVDKMHPHDSAWEHNVQTSISMVFMVLVGLSMPPLLGKNAKGDSSMSAGLIAAHVFVVSLLMVIGKMFPIVCYRDEASWQERLALCMGMCPRGEVGASIIVISLELGVEGPAVIISMCALVINLVLSGGFIGSVKLLLKHATTQAGQKSEDSAASTMVTLFEPCEESPMSKLSDVKLQDV
ncbi:unnamed protein product [Prorocentrum cordatum]|uniref:Sodium/hydrogen exchanger n=1 Tax=Prorocentrum cordatum TaxID=2364126 RepID=A0ABN9UCD4_9DINO|nr:unnamed protein product [Polarella glacialis]